METKTISIDLDAYERLRQIRQENESFSQVIKRVIRPPFDYKGWLKGIAENPMSDEMAATYDEIIESRRDPINIEPPKWPFLILAFTLTLYRPKSPHRTAAQNKLADLVARGELLATTRFNLAELYLEVHLAAAKSVEIQRVKQFLASVQLLGFSRRAAWHYGKTRAFLQKQGRPIADLDLLIAVTALSTGHIVITRNPGHFSRVPGLVVESY